MSCKSQCDRDFFTSRLGLLDGGAGVLGREGGRGRAGVVGLLVVVVVVARAGEKESGINLRVRNIPTVNYLHKQDMMHPRQNMNLGIFAFSSPSELGNGPLVIKHTGKHYDLIALILRFF